MELWRKVSAMVLGRPRPAVVETTATRIDFVSSQGLVAARDGSAAMMHESSTPSLYYKFRYGSEFGLNMDRGGFGQSSNTTNFACVFDGVSCGGAINLYAAQAFADYTLEALRRYHHDMNVTSLQQITQEIFTAATQKENNPKRFNPAFEGELGSATAVFAAVEVVESERTLVVHGAAVGDAVAILVNSTTTRASMLNTVARLQGNPRDTGGQLTLCQGILGEISYFSRKVQPQDFILLATDGLTDNIDTGDFHAIIPFIMASPAFDVIPAVRCESVWLKLNAHLPTLAELRKLFDTPADDLSDVSCVQAVLRLTNYQKWVTIEATEEENAYFLLCLEDQELCKIRPPTEDTTTRREAIAQELSRMEVLRKRTRACKTDDCLVVAFHPCR
eukprot:m.136181 g.136181  ORF g.136181 m.136181 type:complete len:390 (-) comp52469_c0_seq1:259-1428(-)